MKTLTLIAISVLILLTTLLVLCLWEGEGLCSICPEPLVINKTLTWTKTDAKVLKDTEEKNCKRWFGKDSCLIKFKKVRELSYYATCKNFK